MSMIELIYVGRRKYPIEQLKDLPERELADVINFGTSMHESFSSYVIRIEAAVDLWLTIKGNLHPHILNVIMGIFEDVCCNPQGIKYPQVVQHLKRTLNREPTLADLNSMVDGVRMKLEDKIRSYDGKRQERVLPQKS